MGAHRSVRFRQADVTRALAGAKKAGVNVQVTIDPRGNIVIVPCEPVTVSGAANEWDEVLR